MPTQEPLAAGWRLRDEGRGDEELARVEADAVRSLGVAGAAEGLSGAVSAAA